MSKAGFGGSRGRKLIRSLKRKRYHVKHPERQQKTERIKNR